MFCPNCGQEKVANETNYCSRCGFLLTGIVELITGGGVGQQGLTKTKHRGIWKRNRGLKQGLFIFLLTFLVVPLVAIITIAVEGEPYAVAISAILLFVGGLLRMAYALMFESSGAVEGSEDPPVIGGPVRSVTGILGGRQLPPRSADSYISPATGGWRDTNDLQPSSVVDATTKLLNDDAHDQ